MKPGQTLQDNQLLFSWTPSKRPKIARAGFAKLRQEILNLFATGQYQKVESLLESAQIEETTRFFEDQGHPLLHYAVAAANSLTPLQLIIQHFPKEVIQKLLQINDGEILAVLFSAHHAMETYAAVYYTEKERAQRQSIFSEKIKIIHDIGGGILSSFLCRNAHKSYASASTKEAVAEAISQKPSSACGEQNVNELQLFSI